MISAPIEPQDRPPLSLGAVVLSGGKSSRIGFDKTLLRISGEPLLLRVIYAASRVSTNIVLAIGIERCEKDYLAILPSWVRVVKDTTEQKAPLLGMITGLEVIDAEYAAVLASDMPFINPEVIRRLQYEAKGFDLAIPRWPNDYIEPLCAVYNVRAVTNIFKQSAKTGQVRIRDAVRKLERVNYVAVSKFRDIDPQLQCFLNINTIRDLILIGNVKVQTNSTLQNRVAEQIRSVHSQRLPLQVGQRILGDAD